MKVTLELVDGPFALFAKHLAEQSGQFSIGEYLNRLLINAMELHPDYRHCSNPECCVDVQPVMIATEKKHVNNPDHCYSVSTAPNPNCPECGAATVGIIEGMKIAEADPKYVQQLAVRLDFERQLENNDAA